LGAKAVDHYSLGILDKLSLYCRTLMMVMYNHAASGHPGGSISSCNMTLAAMLHGMNFDFRHPDEETADVLIHTAGHKALARYAIFAALDTLVEASGLDLLPEEISSRLELSDLLVFRRNPSQETALARGLAVNFLDGHPTPATPFTPIATGASGVGVAAALGFAFALLDRYGWGAPRVCMIEGEGGLTPGPVYEVLSLAATNRLHNAILLVDFNNCSIDSNRVCRQGRWPGDYVQWNPMELFAMHGWNVVEVPDGHDFGQVIAALGQAKRFRNRQPTAIVCHTTKGRDYGIEGRASHGAGHQPFSEGYFQAIKPFEDEFGVKFPDHNGKPAPEVAEGLYWNTLQVFKQVANDNRVLASYVGHRLLDSRRRLAKTVRVPRPDAPNLDRLSEAHPDLIPEALIMVPGSKSTLRGALGKTLGELNKLTGGGIFVAAADLQDSTSVSLASSSDGFYEPWLNRNSRKVSAGGICEYGATAFMTGVSVSGRYIGAVSSYAAFLAALGHIASRLHCIGQQALHELTGEPFRTFIMVCAHAGFMTGEDGPTHADPQALQLLQDNFPLGSLITLTPGLPDEVWSLVIAGLLRRPAVLAPFVTRPSMSVIDREKYSLRPAAEAANGVYYLRRQTDTNDTVILQGCEVVGEFVSYVLPRMDERGWHFNVLCVTSSELYDLLPQSRREEILPRSLMNSAMGITGFTLPTIHRWIRSAYGLEHTLHAFSKGYYPGSGPASAVLKQAGLDGEAQWEAVQRYTYDR
jgi:transketolase